MGSYGGQTGLWASPAHTKTPIKLSPPPPHRHSKHRLPAGGHKPASKTFLKMQTNMIVDTRGTPTPEARTTFFVTNRRSSKRRPVKETNPCSPGGQGSVAGLRSPKKRKKNQIRRTSLTRLTKLGSNTWQPRRPKNVGCL